MFDPPYKVVMKPYGQALVDLARRRDDVVCLGADLTRQTETDLFRDELPDRFFNVGMAEANLIGIAGGLARTGLVVFVNTFGAFATRRCFDQLAMSVAYPNLNVKVIGFMPGVSSPGGPSHQAVEDIASMRALPNFTVVDVADAVETMQVVGAIADWPGPVYLRLKRGEIPVIFDGDHTLDLEHARVLRRGGEGVVIIASGMMLAAALGAADFLQGIGFAPTVVNVTAIKPLDTTTLLDVCHGAQVVVTAENHSVIGGLGSALAEVLAEAAMAVPLRRVGIPDVFAESGSRPYLFAKYGLSQQSIVNAVWDGLGLAEPTPQVPETHVDSGAYAPV